MRFKSQNLQPADCGRLRFISQPALRRLRIESQPAGCDSSPKTCIPQVTIQFATCTPQGCDSIRNLQVAIAIPPISLQPTGCDSSRSCDSSPKTCIPQVAIQFATCKLQFQSQNLHPTGCDSIRNLHSAGSRLNSQPASCDSSPKSLQPAGCDSLRGCDSNPKTCIPQVAIQFPTCKLRCRSFPIPPIYKVCNPQVAIRVEVAIPVPKACNPHRLRFTSRL